MHGEPCQNKYTMSCMFVFCFVVHFFVWRQHVHSCYHVYTFPSKPFKVVALNLLSWPRSISSSSHIRNLYFARNKVISFYSAETVEKSLSSLLLLLCTNYILHNNGARLAFIFPSQHSFFFLICTYLCICIPIWSREFVCHFLCSPCVCLFSYTYFRRCINILSELRHKKVIAKVTTAAGGVY